MKKAVKIMLLVAVLSIVLVMLVSCFSKYNAIKKDLAEIGYEEIKESDYSDEVKKTIENIEASAEKQDTKVECHVLKGAKGVVMVIEYKGVSEVTGLTANMVNGNCQLYPLVSITEIADVITAFNKSEK